ncbi:MAG: coenzyme hydrogenase subunit beta [Candidatus Binatota bacterium]|nr:coenzyme hydrogenase subunit beta [Candidatus Binatota bacterium]
MVDGLVPAHADGGPPLRVVPESLCTRCGVCDPICPTDVVRFDDRALPVIETEGCIACGLCVAVCPGVDFDYKAEYWQRFGVADPPRWLGGVYQSAWLCSSSSTDVRREGSGGGVVTQILMGLLAEGEIDAAVTVGAHPDDPLKPEPVVCRTPEELLATAGSKYCVVPQAKALRQVRRLPGRFAFVGVGCQIEGLRRLEGFNKSLARRKILTIGLACHGTLEREATTDLLERKRVPLRSVVRFRYRGGKFPGKFQAELPGEVRDLHRYEYKDSAYNYLFHLYTPSRCLDCPDFTAEFTDLSVTDFWVRDENGEYLHPEGASLVLCRNERAESLLRMLIAKGHLVGGAVSKDDVDRSFRHLDHEKRVAPFLRWERARRAGRFAPNYHLDPPAVTLSDRAWETLFRATFVFSRWRSTRRLMVWVLFSRFGDAVTWMNMRRKRRRARRRARRGGRFTH